MNFDNFFQMSKFASTLCLYYILLCQRGNKHFDVRLWGIRPNFLSRKLEKSGIWGREWKDECLFPARVVILSL